jgi:SAM-dependent methyltransferase
MTTDLQLPEAFLKDDLLVDLACGDNKKAGYLGVDKFQTSSTDLVFDLLSSEWPLRDGSVKEFHCSHFFEHIPGLQRPTFMDNAYRALQPGGKMVIITPYWSSKRAVQDFTHAWPPVCEDSFLYFNKEWRKTNKLEHGLYDMKCDFDFGYGFGLNPEITVRNQEYQQHYLKFNLNSVSDVYVTLTKTVRPIA